MAYFIFLKNLNNINGTFCKFSENIDDLNKLNIMQSDYKIIEDSESNFNLVKFGNKIPLKYNDNTIVYEEQNGTLETKDSAQKYVTNYKELIKNFLDNNPNHPLFNRWNDYYNQLNNLNLNSITFPLNKSLEQYFKDLGQTSLHPLQIP